MTDGPDPGLVRDLTDAKAALTRHGIVIARSIETDLGAAIMAEAKNSLASSSEKLAEMGETELDRFVESLRKAALESSAELNALYVRLLARLGTEDMSELVKEFDGIRELFKWERVVKATDPVNKLLDRKGFAPITLADPSDVSEEFAIELNERWPVAFERFRELAQETAAKAGHKDVAKGPPRRGKPKKRRQSG